MNELLEKNLFHEAIVILKEYLVICPYCREAVIQLLYCYYMENDLVNLQKLLQKAMAPMHSVVKQSIFVHSFIHSWNLVKSREISWNLMKSHYQSITITNSALQRRIQSSESRRQNPSKAYIMQSRWKCQRNRRRLWDRIFPPLSE